MTSLGIVIALALALAAVHVFIGRLHGLRTMPRHWWLSVGSGVSVAYVFVHLLPEITERQARLMEVSGQAWQLPLSTWEHLLFIAVLAGFSTYYGFEQLVRVSQDEAEGCEVCGVESRTTARVFWVHIGAFTGYNLLVGYLLVKRDMPGTLDLAFYATAMAMHLAVNDHGLRDHHREAYHRIGRWILAASVVVGALIGYLLMVPELLTSLLFAFLGGAIVLNVIKEELPEERDSRFDGFAGGVLGYTIVLLVL